MRRNSGRQTGESGGLRGRGAPSASRAPSSASRNRFPSARPRIAAQRAVGRDDPVASAADRARARTGGLGDIAIGPALACQTAQPCAVPTGKTGRSNERPLLAATGFLSARIANGGHYQLIICYRRLSASLTRWSIASSTWRPFRSKPS